MYVYNEFRNALIGKDGDKSKDFSPNNVRCIMLGNGFVFIAYHTKRPKLVNLDMTEVAKDFQKGGSTGSLTNLLKKYQMSCLEEIYIGNIYMNNRGFIDLEGYVQTLNPKDSRLRYYGYIEGENPNEISTLFTNAITQHLDGWCYALEKNRSARVQYSDTNNRDWYKRHSLRPDSYAIDKKGGALDRALCSIESRISGKIEDIKAQEDAQNLADVLARLYNQDLARKENLLIFYKLCAVLAKDAGLDSDLQDVYTPSVRELCSEISEHMYDRSVKISMSEFGKICGSRVGSPDDKLLTCLGQFAGTMKGCKEPFERDDEYLAQSLKAGYGLSAFSYGLRGSLQSWFERATYESKRSVINTVMVLQSMGYKTNGIDSVINTIDSLDEKESLYLLLGLAGYTVDSLKQE